MNKSQFKTLQAEWYEKLQKDGFKDIEDGEMLKSWHSSYFQSRYEPDYFKHKEEYFRKCRMFLSSYSFASKADREIWSLHTDGKSLREISQILKDRPGNFGKDTVRGVIKRLTEEMQTVDEQPDFGFNPISRRKR